MTTTTHRLLHLVVLGLLVLAKAVQADNNDEEACGLYFAPSSIPNAGYGLYTGVARQNNTTLSPDAPDVNFMMNCDLMSKVLVENNSNLTIHHKAAINMPSSYWWGIPSSTFAKSEGSSNVLKGLIPSYANSHPHFNNVELTSAEIADETLLNRFTSPGAGAVNVHHGNTRTTQDLKPGQEIFIDYGDRYFLAREEEFNHIHKTKLQYEQATVLINGVLEFENTNDCKFNVALVNFIKSDILDYLGMTLWQAFPEDIHVKWSSIQLPENLKEDNPQVFYTLVTIFEAMDAFKAHSHTDEYISFDKCIDLFKSIIKIFRPRLAAALPDNVRDMKYLSEHGITSLEIKDEDRIRDLDWLKANGVCMDNIAKIKSNTKDAGYGAAARRTLKKGEVIAGVPLIVINEPSYLNLHKSYNYTQETVGHQLYMNYCFGHKQSSLLLCMLTSSVWINHKATGNGANVEYRWASWPKDSTQNALKMPLEDLKRVAHRTVSFEIVALKDIEAGEEIYMDYGEDWEEAWDKHVREWQPPTGVFTKYKPLEQFVEENEEKPILTDKEQLDNPYPGNIGFFCYFSPHISEEHMPFETEPSLALFEEVKDHFSQTRNSLIDKLAVDFDTLPAEMQQIDFSHYSNDWYGCEVIDRSETGDKYIVRFYGDIFAARVPFPVIMKNLPRSGIKTVPKPFLVDAYLPGTFRHPIMLKDEIFPSHWKDLTI